MKRYTRKERSEVYSEAAKVMSTGYCGGEWPWEIKGMCDAVAFVVGSEKWWGDLKCGYRDHFRGIFRKDYIDYIGPWDIEAGFLKGMDKEKRVSALRKLARELKK